MRARLGGRMLHVVVLIVLAVTAGYNVIRFCARAPRETAPPLYEPGMAIELSMPSPPNWASGQYDVPADWGRNPFTGSEMKDSLSPLSSEMGPRPAEY